MTTTVARRLGIIRVMMLAGLVMTLNTAVVAAQDSPAPTRDPATQQKKAHDPRPGRLERWPGAQLPGPAARGRPAPAVDDRLTELEAKLDALIHEVRQLRREIQRQRTHMQLGSRGPQPGPWSPPYAQHGAFRAPGGWQTPWGPQFQGPPAGFGPPPWAGKRTGPPPLRDRAGQKPAPDRERDGDRDPEPDAR